LTVHVHRGSSNPPTTSFFHIFRFCNLQLEIPAHLLLNCTNPQGRAARFDHSITDYFIPVHNDEQNVANLLLAPGPQSITFSPLWKFPCSNLVIINVKYDEKAKPTELANDMSLALIKSPNNNNNNFSYNCLLLEEYEIQQQRSSTLMAMISLHPQLAVVVWLNLVVHLNRKTANTNAVVATGFVRPCPPYTALRLRSVSRPQSCWICFWGFCFFRGEPTCCKVLFSHTVVPQPSMGSVTSCSLHHRGKKKPK
jgi:hypothetical protein